MDVAASIEQAILDRLAKAAGAAGKTPNPDSNIMHYIDSYAFLEMILDLTERFGIDIDLSEAETEEMIFVSRLARLIAAQVTPGEMP